MGSENDVTAQSTALSPAAAGKSREVEQEALDAVIAATQAYLPPDGISAQECINRILGAVDNPRIVAALRSRLQPAAAVERASREDVSTNPSPAERHVVVPEFTQHRRTQIAEMRPFVPGETLRDRVSISKSDLEAGSPKLGDMIARNPKNHEDQWLVAAGSAALDLLEEVRSHGK